MFFIKKRKSKKVYRVLAVDRQIMLKLGVTVTSVLLYKKFQARSHPSLAVKTYNGFDWETLDDTWVPCDEYGREIEAGPFDPKETCR